MKFNVGDTVELTTNWYKYIKGDRFVVESVMSLNYYNCRPLNDLSKIYTLTEIDIKLSTNIFNFKGVSFTPSDILVTNTHNFNGCECGSHKIGSNFHSNWCPLYER